MMRKRLSPRMMGSALILMLLISCTASPLAPTLSPVPATLTPTTIPTTPTMIPATSTRTPLPPPVSPEFPTGSFFHQHAAASFCVFQFNQDGTYAYYWLVSSVDVTGKEPYATGTYSTDGNLFIETSTDVPGCPSPATYAWTYDGQTLTFQAVGEDQCSDRQGTYESPLFYTRVE